MSAHAGLEDLSLLAWFLFLRIQCINSAYLAHFFPRCLFIKKLSLFLFLVPGAQLSDLHLLAVNVELGVK